MTDFDFLLHRRSLFATISVNMSLLEAVTLITIPRWLTSTGPQSYLKFK
ncbi:hypothetical protein NC652_007329 [Populus alba x Populus x berolinensis]|nr:hypothetical protein NC652_007329 [Populus alba x Populus x berolinensis]